MSETSVKKKCKSLYLMFEFPINNIVRLNLERPCLWWHRAPHLVPWKKSCILPTDSVWDRLLESSHLHVFPLLPIRGDLKWTLHPWLNISMFCVLYQNYQHFFWLSKLSKELKNSIEILVGQAEIIKLWNVKVSFWSITQKPPGILKFKCYFWVPWTIYCNLLLFFKVVLIILR